MWFDITANGRALRPVLGTRDSGLASFTGDALLKTRFVAPGTRKVVRLHFHMLRATHFCMVPTSGNAQLLSFFVRFLSFIPIVIVKALFIQIYSCITLV